MINTVKNIYSRSLKGYKNKIRGEKIKDEHIKEGLGFKGEYSGKVIDLPESITIISAVYNTSLYLNEFISSIIRQKININKNLKIILVNDGSTDNSLNICNDWARKYPRIITVLNQVNQGPAIARNTGLNCADTEWVTFCDSDDILGWNYLSEFSKFIYECESFHANPQLISCRLKIYWENTGKISVQHPLDYKFSSGNKVFDVKGNHDLAIQLSVNNAFFKNNVIKNNSIKFVDIKPSFEDALFVAKFINKSNDKMGVVKESHYLYRKRKDESSLINTAWDKEGKYIDQLVKGNLGLISEIIESKGQLPRWASNIVIYDLMWHFKKFVNKGLQELSSKDEIFIDCYKDNIRKVLSAIPREHIKENKIPSLDKSSRSAMLSFDTRVSESNEYISAQAYNIDIPNNLLEIRVNNVSSKNSVIKFLEAGEQIEAEFIKRIDNYFIGYLLDHTYICWIKRSDISILTLEVDNVELSITGAGHLKKFSSQYIDNNLPKLNKVKPRINEFSKHVHRYLALNTNYGEKFKNAWLLMDRDTDADDNAEHLYRYINNNKKEINIFFVLRKTSPDWPRLQRENFKLVEFGSIEHKHLLLNCEFLISSHADEYIFNVMKPKFYQDIIKYKFIFLQHGITQNDISEWLNKKNISLFATASTQEYTSIASDGNNYKFSQHEVSLTGFPRHDKLYEKNNLKSTKNKKRIIIMPTWRKSLVGLPKPGTNERQENTNFINTDFYKDWKMLLDKISDLYYVNSGQVEVVFYPHVNLSAYNNLFKTDNIRIVNRHEIKSMQDFFVSADVMITDYSSVAFEMGFLEKPVLYYQTGKDDIYSGGHLTVKGYYCYHNNGFGPVANTIHEVNEYLIELLENDFEMSEKYKVRSRNIFPYPKGLACERVFTEIMHRV